MQFHRFSVAELMSLPGAVRQGVYLMALWFVLNTFDLMTSFSALADGRAAELNPFMAAIIPFPLLAAVVKIMGAYAVVKLVERLSNRSVHVAIGTLAGVNAFMVMICLNNIAFLF